MCYVPENVSFSRLNPLLTMPKHPRKQRRSSRLHRKENHFDYIDEVELSDQDHREQEIMNALTVLRDLAVDMIGTMDSVDATIEEVPENGGFTDIIDSGIFNRATSMLKTFKLLQNRVNDFYGTVLAHTLENPDMYDHIDMELHLAELSDIEEEEEGQQQEDGDDDDDEEKDAGADAESKLEDQPSELAYLNTCLPFDPST